MTPARIAALEKVAEAGRGVRLWAEHGTEAQLNAATERMLEALAALDALDAAQPAQETVEVRSVVKRDRLSQTIHVYGRSELTDNELVNWCPGNEVLAFQTARVPLPSVPTIAATVTLDREPGR